MGTAKQCREQGQRAESGAIAASARPVAVTGKAHEWKSLFDGKSIDGWETIGNPRKVSNHALTSSEKSVFRTAAKYPGFELEMEWRVDRGANGGVFYVAGDGGNNRGPELQMCDPKVAGSPQSGGLYGVLAYRNIRIRDPGRQGPRQRLLKKRCPGRDGGPAVRRVPFRVLRASVRILPRAERTSAPRLSGDPCRGARIRRSPHSGIWVAPRSGAASNSRRSHRSRYRPPSGQNKNCRGRGVDLAGEGRV
jgi:hypothetical protein